MWELRSVSGIGEGEASHRAVKKLVKLVYVSRFSGADKDEVLRLLDETWASSARPVANEEIPPAEVRAPRKNGASIETLDGFVRIGSIYLEGGHM
jgi:hypothetical protein